MSKVRGCTGEKRMDTVGVAEIFYEGSNRECIIFTC